jgi:hypothetical protein
LPVQFDHFTDVSPGHDVRLALAGSNLLFPKRFTSAAILSPNTLAAQAPVGSSPHSLEDEDEGGVEEE